MSEGLSIEMFVIKRKKQYLFNQMIYGKDVAPCCQHPSLKVIAMQLTQATQVAERLCYSVSHNFIYPSKELCSKMALGEVGVSLP